MSLVTMIPSDGHFGPDVAVGWPLRFEILTYCVWLMVAAQQAIHLSRAGGKTLESVVEGLLS